MQFLTNELIKYVNLVCRTKLLKLNDAQLHSHIETSFLGSESKTPFVSWTSLYLVKTSQFLIRFSFPKALFEFCKLISGCELNSNHVQLNSSRLTCSVKPTRWPSPLGLEWVTAHAARRPAGARRNGRKRMIPCQVRRS